MSSRQPINRHYERLSLDKRELVEHVIVVLTAQPEPTVENSLIDEPGLTVVTVRS